MSETLLRELTPQVLAVLVRRGNEFAAAEDAVQEALIDALRTWPENPPRDPRAWLTTAAVHRLTDAVRSEAARRKREERADDEPEPGPTEQADDTLLLLFLCASPELSPASAVALTLRAVAGLTTREIADAFLVPEATMAQRISRAKRTIAGARLDTPGDVGTVLRVAAGIITDPTGRTLLVRKRGTSLFMNPGGKYETGETAPQTLVRELREELGLVVAEAALTYVGFFETDAANEAGHALEAEVYALATTEPVSPLAEIEELRWVDPTALGDAPVAPLVRLLV